MLSYRSVRSGFIVAFAGILYTSGVATARESITTSHRVSELKTTVTRCLPATAAIDIDINNVNARLMTGGDMWWNIGEGVAAYEIPKGSGKSSQFAASCWIGGIDEQHNLKVAAQMYRQDGNDYWPGALDATAQIDYTQCSAWDQFWKIDKTTINSFIAASKSGSVNLDDPQWAVIKNWPGKGNKDAIGTNGVSLGLDQGIFATRTYAPFVDVDSNHIYSPSGGDYPQINGDQFIWWVFNDAGNVKQQSQTAAIGVEIQTSAFAYSTQDFLNNSTFYQYEVWNRGALTLDSTFIAVWDDCDLGYYMDDYIGCDTVRGLGIQYNGTNDDGGSANHPVNSYGLYPPMVGVDFFQGPFRHSDSTQLSMTNFTYFNNDNSIIGNPSNGVQIYNYMTGTIRDGEHFSDDFQGSGTSSKGYGSGPYTHFVYFGDPGIQGTWSECACNNTPGDRRFIFSSGPFQLKPGDKNDIIFGCIWAPQPTGGCPDASFKTIKSIDDGAQALFDDHFKTIEGPNAPRLAYRELDRKIIFYMINDYGSNNFGEHYGDTAGSYKDSLQYHQTVSKAVAMKDNDSLYKFEGYMVFQLANSGVNASQIFNSTTGEVDPAVASLVFQCDVHNGVSTIINYVKDVSISDTTYLPQVKINGKDSGITHSFVLTQDAFATGADQRFIDYHSYYFVAVAYSYNNFAPFNALNVGSTQDVAFLMSAHAANGADIKIDTCIPNPSNGAIGTVLNCDYGTGVNITRLEGQGNGGNFVQLDSASEMKIVNNNVSDTLTYLANYGPISVKIIDPAVVPAYDWTLQIIDKSTKGASVGFSTASWMLTAKKNNVAIDTIYSENDLSVLNEQIIEKYGISITVQQHYAPSQAPLSAPYNQLVDNNGYIGSDVTFDDPDQPWLSGVTSVPGYNFTNWERSGITTVKLTYACKCYFNANKLDSMSNYVSMFSNYSTTKGTWAPYNLCADWVGNEGDSCSMEIAYSSSKNLAVLKDMGNIPDVNLVFTPDTSLWTRCAVIEMQEDVQLAQGGAQRFGLRKHLSWNKQIGGDGVTPVYASEASGDYGMSWFPGYAIDEASGRRLNIVFGEDSYAASDNGNDMLWNPSSREFNPFDNSILFGGKHITYILNTTYDKDSVFVANLKLATASNPKPARAAYTPFEWAGVPLTNHTVAMKTLAEGYIPTKTTLRFRVVRPYAPDTVQPAPADTIGGNAYFPYYSFSTKNLAPAALSDTTNRGALLSRIFAVPNPYYGYSGYETNRLDTKVRIINLPASATIYIYALDGTLIRVLTKTDPSVSYVDWDIRNAIGLPIASGMYIMDVKADGIGEVVLKWFGAQRPLDITTY